MNPNKASYESLSQIPFLSDREISLIIAERKKRPFSSIRDLASRIGLLPFETTYLSNIFYFGNSYTFSAICTIDTSYYFRMSLFSKNLPVVLLWKHQNSIHFMNAVHTHYFSVYQGYVLPVFRGGLTEFYGIIRRKDGFKIDTTYNFGFSTKYFLIFHTPYENISRFYIMKSFSILYIRGNSLVKEAYTFSYTSEGLYIETGSLNKKPVFYISSFRRIGKNVAFFDIYSRYTTQRIYGGHIYSRYSVGKSLSIKTYASYKHTFSGYLRLSLAFHLRIPGKPLFFNAGVKKNYYNNTRVYLSTGKYGKNYIYFSLTKSIGSSSYLLRYSLGVHGVTLSYALSEGQEKYIFLDDTKSGYFLGTLVSRFKLGYRFSFKNVTLSLYYIRNSGKNIFRTQIRGRFSY